MSRHRENFTSDDDKLLIKYLAHYSKDGSKRLGNTLYHTLVENEGNKWPWSKRHPWQSWRERYKKHQGEFDYKIKQRLKKLREREGAEEEEEGSAVPVDAIEGKEMPPAKPVTKATASAAVKKKAANGVSSRQPEDRPKQTAKTARKTTTVLRDSDEILPPTKQGSERINAGSSGSPSEESRKRKRGSDGPSRESKAQKKTKVFEETKRRDNDELQKHTGNSSESLSDSEFISMRQNAKEPTNTSPPSSNIVAAQGSSKPQDTGESFVRKGRPKNRPQDNTNLPSKSDRLPEVVSAEKSDSLHSSGSAHHALETKETNATISVSMAGSANAKAMVKSLNNTEGATRKTTARDPDVIAALRTISEHVRPQLREMIFQEFELTEETQNELFVTQDIPNDDVLADEQDPYENLYPDLNEELQNAGLPSATSSPKRPGSSSSKTRNLGGSEKQVDQDVDMENPNEVFNPPSPADFEPVEDAASQIADDVDDNKSSGDDPPEPTESPPPSIPAPTRTGDRYVVLSSPEKGPSSSPLAPLTKRSPPRRVNCAFRSEFVVPRTASKSRGQAVGSDSSDEDDEDAKLLEAAASKSVWPPIRGTQKSSLHAKGGKEENTVSAPAHVSDSEEFDPYGRSQNPVKHKPKRQVTVNATPGPSTQVPQPEPEPEQVQDPPATSTYDHDSPGDELPRPPTPIIPEEPEANRAVTPQSDEPVRRDKGKGRAAVDGINRRETFGGFVRPRSPLHKESDGASRRDRRSLGAERAHSRRSMGRRESLFSDRDEDSGRDRKDRRQSFYSSLEVPSNIELSQMSPKPDEDMAKHVGFKIFFHGMAKNHGFSEDIVKRIYDECGSLPKTDKLLRNMRKAYQQQALVDLGYDSDEKPVVDMDVDDKSAEFESEKLSRKERKRSSTRSADLKWMPADNEILRRTKNVYTPPSRSRAADHARKVASEQALRKAERKRTAQPSQLQTPVPSDNVGRSQTPSTPADTRQATPRLIVFPQKTPQYPQKQRQETQPEAWTAEDDEVIRLGEDQDALQAIEARRGPGSVKNRFTELLLMEP
ncbi:hypothetical protein SCHPADRAFT_898628 [Schizopora paradoxa]|uniref:TERF2-interacting telomeric protein 1 Myb domain-containing protein n=1 Tax=Schizopora paradoxa TaxID=27342 RepID=A0A0H2S6T7_9AGAM|nr:hypothetical protein SCHPADRAFT_898628 [Schizopora paradoxa]